MIDSVDSPDNCQSNLFLCIVLRDPMESWVVALEKQLLAQNETFARCTAVLRSKLTNDQVKRLKCGKCDSLTWIGALVKFPCERRIAGTDYEVDHALCFDCLEDRLERHRGFLERERYKPDQRSQYDRCLECVITCDECHTPAVISRKIGYEGGIQTEDDGESGNRRRVRYGINEELTAKLRDRFKMHSYFENQRRSPFSKFSKDKLFRIERPSISNADGAPAVGDQQTLESGFVWLEDWRVVANVALDEVHRKPSGGAHRSGPVPSALTEALTDASFTRFPSEPNLSGGAVTQAAVANDLAQTVTDPSGWQYAFIWPSSDSTLVRWVNKPTAKTFVRRRKKVRAYLELTPEVKAELQAFCRKEEAARVIL